VYDCVFTTDRDRVRESIDLEGWWSIWTHVTPCSEKRHCSRRF